MIGAVWRRLRDRLFRRESPAPTVSGPPPLPQRVVYAVGDVHGQDDLLERLLVAVDADIGGIGAEDPVLVFVGNYVDHHRGHPLAAMERLRDLTIEMPRNVICLMGAHERMMLDCLDDPAGAGVRWLRNGGRETLVDLGVLPPREPPPMADVAARLRRALPSGLEYWLRERPLTWSSGTLAVVPAAADPSRAIDAQPERVLLWGHPAFGIAPRADGLWIAHGHGVTRAPVAVGGRIALDTGAWHTGVLSAARILPDGTVTFIQASR